MSVELAEVGVLREQLAAMGPRLGWTPTEFGRLVGKSQIVVLRWIREGHLQARRVDKQNYLITIKNAEDFLGMEIPNPPEPRQGRSA